MKDLKNMVKLETIENWRFNNEPLMKLLDDFRGSPPSAFKQTEEMYKTVLMCISRAVYNILSEQESEHKKQMREAIEEVGKELEDSEGDSAFAAGLETALDIFVKHNCEEGKK